MELKPRASDLIRRLGVCLLAVLQCSWSVALFRTLISRIMYIPSTTCTAPCSPPKTHPLSLLPRLSSLRSQHRGLQCESHLGQLRWWVTLCKELLRLQLLLFQNELLPLQLPEHKRRITHITEQRHRYNSPAGMEILTSNSKGIAVRTVTVAMYHAMVSPFEIACGNMHQWVPPHQTTFHLTSSDSANVDVSRSTT